MSEQDERASQLSAMFDGELPDAECELVARRLSRDPELRRSWSNYGLIGAVLRSEPLAPTELAPRVRAALANEPAVDPAAQPPQIVERPLHLPRWAVPVSGVGVAAGLAAVAVFWWAMPGDPNVSTATVVPSAPNAHVSVSSAGSPVGDKAAKRGPSGKNARPAMRTERLGSRPCRKRTAASTVAM